MKGAWWVLPSFYGLVLHGDRSYEKKIQPASKTLDCPLFRAVSASILEALLKCYFNSQVALLSVILLSIMYFNDHCSVFEAWAFRGYAFWFYKGTQSEILPQSQVDCYFVVFVLTSLVFIKTCTSTDIVLSVFSWGPWKCHHSPWRLSKFPQHITSLEPIFLTQRYVVICFT